MNTGLDEVLILNLVVFRAPGSEGAEGSGGIADGADLRVSRRVIVGSDSVGAGCDENCGMFEMGTHYVFIQYRKVRSIVVLSKSRLQAMANILGQSGILLKEMMR